MEPVFIVLAAAGTAISIVGVSVQAIKIIYYPDSKKDKKSPVDPNNQYTDNELRKLNQLYFCQVCDRYSRNHMLELDVLKRELETGRSGLRKCCPNCQSQSIYTATEKYSWQENHRHCFKLKPEQYSEYKNDVQKWRNAIKDAEELKAFEEYESKHLANGPISELEKETVPEWQEEAIDLISRFKASKLLDSVEYDNVLLKEVNGDVKMIEKSLVFKMYGKEPMPILMTKGGHEVLLLPDNRILIQNVAKFKPPVSMMDGRRELEETRRKNAQAEIDRAFDMQVYSKYEKGGVTMEEAAESLAAYQKNWR